MHCIIYFYTASTFLDLSNSTYFNFIINSYYEKTSYNEMST